MYDGSMRDNKHCYPHKDQLEISTSSLYPSREIKNTNIKYKYGWKGLMVVDGSWHFIENYNQKCLSWKVSVNIGSIKKTQHCFKQLMVVRYKRFDKTLNSTQRKYVIKFSVSNFMLN